MQSTEKPKGGRNKQATSKSKGDGGTLAERSVHTFVAGLSESNRVQHRGNFLFMLQNLVGFGVLIRTRDGGEIRGVFNTATPFDTARGTEIVIKMAIVKGGKKAIEKGSTVIISIDDVLSLEATGIDIKSSKDAAASGDLQTDGDIGKSTKLGAAELQSLQGRDLASVDSSWLSSDAMGSLEGGGKSKKGGNTSWDQFEVNKRLYNVNSSYDENLYTKPLNRNELTRDQIKKADKYAKEIEGTRSSNVHLQEERGQVMERDMDEEDLYSGVLRPAAAPSPTAKAPKAASSSSSGGSWRRAVTGEPSSPTTVPTSAAPPGLSKGNKPCPMAGGNVKAKNAGKGKSGPARVASPPAYDDDFIPVPSNAEGARKSPPATAAATAPKSQEPDASGGKGTQEKRAESPDISFFAVPEEKPPPALGKGEEPKTEKKEPVTAEVSADKKDPAPAVAVATSSKLNANAKEFKFNANAKEFVFTPKAATAPAAAPVVPAGQAANPGGKQHGGNRRFDSHGGNQGYQSHGYPENGYGGPPQQWAHGGSMMYSNGGMMMNGPIVPPVGEMPMMGGYPIYPDMGYGGGGPMMGHVPGQMYPNAPPMHMGPGGYDPSYGGAGPHMGGRGGGRGGYGGGRGGRGNYNAGGAHGTGQQGDGAARGRSSSHSSAHGGNPEG